eukprot:455003-Prymnesium_polylepis.1
MVFLDGTTAGSSFHFDKTAGARAGTDNTDGPARTIRPPSEPARNPRQKRFGRPQHTNGTAQQRARGTSPRSGAQRDPTRLGKGRMLRTARRGGWRRATAPAARREARRRAELPADEDAACLATVVSALGTKFLPETREHVHNLPSSGRDALRCAPAARAERGRGAREPVFHRARQGRALLPRAAGARQAGRRVRLWRGAAARAHARVQEGQAVRDEPLPPLPGDRRRGVAALRPGGA